MKLDVTANNFRLYQDRISSFIPVLLLTVAVSNSSAEILGKTSLIINGQISTPKPFFVQLILFPSTQQHDLTTCGGTIIGTHWVATSAECVNEGRPAFVDYGHYMGHREQVTAVAEVFPHANFMYMNGVPLYNIALVKTTHEFPMIRILPMCSNKPHCGSLMGTCGLGSLHLNSDAPTSTLHQAYLREVDLPELNQSPASRICTTGFPSQQVLLARGDRGSPLYTLQAELDIANCLYGVASHQRLFQMVAVNYFTSIPFFYDWILNVMANG